MKKKQTKSCTSLIITRKTLKIVRLLTFFILLGINCALASQGYSQVTSLSVDAKNKSLRSVFNSIESQSEFVFFYNNDQIDENETVSVQLKDAHLDEILDQILSEKYSYKIEDKHVLISKNYAVQQQTADKYTIRGTVYSSNEPPEKLVGVSVRIKDTQRAVMTDLDGFFSIEANKGDILQFSYLGFTSYEYKVTKQESNVSVVLREELAALDEVVVTGMTAQQRKHIASAVSMLNVESNIVGKPITTISQSLQGGVTGLQVSQGSGLPGGDAATIKIRGISTLGTSNPLVLVDGIPMDMNHIDPVTIESVTVLKDAAAAAIYGARAANGVIMISTKRGKVGKVKVTYDGYYGIQTPTVLPETVDATRYMMMYNEAYLNGGNSTPYYSMDMIKNTYYGNDPLRYPDTDWIDLMINKAPIITSHSLSVSGGNNLARFAITGNYIYQDGMTPVTKNSRFNVRANTSTNLAENFLINLDVLAIKRNYEEPNRTVRDGGTRLLEDMYRVPPTVLPKYPDNGSGKVMYGRWVDIVNPLAYAEVGGRRFKEKTQATINVQPQWEIIPNLSFKGHFSFRLNSDLDRVERENFNFFDFYTNELVQSWGIQRTATQGRTTYYYLGGSLDYSLKLNKHNIYALAGYSQEETNSGDWNIHSLISSYAKLSYAYDDRYLLEGVVRLDGSSRFGKGNKFGVFPSIAAGWNIHNESFMQNVDFISNLKLRTSYGVLGNENIGLYRYQTLINNSNGVESTWGNPDITWETVNMFDAGIDIGLFNGDLEFTFDYYDKYTKDIILEPQVSYVGGMGNVPINAGEVRNRGFEISLNYFKRINDNLQFSIKPGFSYNKNKIEKLYRGVDIFTNATTVNREGYAINSYYGYKTDGLLQKSDFDGSGNPLVPTMVNAQPGDIKYLDIDGDNQITEADQTVLGDGVPKIQYFTNMTLKYKNFDFDILFQGVGKCYSVLDGMFALPLNMSYDGGVPTKYYARNYWTEERTDAKFPRLSVNPAVNSASSDFWFQNSAYLRVKYIQLGYTIKKDFLSKLNIKQARVYLNAQNPFTSTKTKLVDPESRGLQYTYSIQKVYTVGVNVQF